MRPAAARGMVCILVVAGAIGVAPAILAAEPKHAAVPPAGAMPGQAEAQVQHGRAGPPPRVAAPVPFVSKDGAKKGWKVVIPGHRSLATPAVVGGKVFLGGGFGSYEFYALDAKSGALLWQYRTGDDGPTAAVVDDGYVAFNTESCELEVVTTEGRPVWKKWLGDPLMSMPAIAGARLFMAYPDSRGDHQYYLACFDLKTGELQWRKRIAGEIITAPVVDDEQVFLATLEGTLYCFHARDGALAWTETNKNVTSSPTVAAGRCYFSRRQETTVAKKGKQLKQQTEQVAVRAPGAKAAVRDYAATARVADYLDYAKRAGAGMGGYGGSFKEKQSQKADAGVGFDGGGIEPGSGPKTAPASKPAPAPESSAQAPSPLAGLGSKGSAKMAPAAANLGQATVHGLWSYQGSKPLMYQGRLFSSMGDAIVCVDAQTEQVVWKKQFTAKKAKPEADLLDSTLSPPALANGKAFVGTGSGDVVCMSAATGEVLWSASVGEPIAFQPAVAQGRVYVSTETGNLFGLETGDPADDGWLMWGANAAHNGIVRPSRPRSL